MGGTKRPWKRLAVAVAIMCVAASAVGPVMAADGDFNMEVTAAGIALGPQVSGAPLTPESLAHRVVVLEFWGVNCPPCIAAMPALEQLHKQLGPAGLLVVGAHAQGGTAAELKSKVAELQVTFPIVESAQVAGGNDFNGIPHCMVFDHTGKCVYRGSPGDAHDVVAKAVSLAPSSVLEGRVLIKLAAFNELLKNEAAFASCLKKAKGMVAAKDVATAEEAKYVVEKIEARGRTMLASAQEMKASDPVGAATLISRCAAAFKGDAIGTEAAHVLRDWKKDRGFQSAVKAAQALATLESLRANVLRALGAPSDAVTAEMAQQTPAQVKKQIKDAARAIAQACPGTPMADKAAAIAAEFAVE